MLGFFLFDATFTLVRRLIQGAQITQPHREHLYQRLILSGWSRQHVAAVSAGMALLMAVLGSAVFLAPQYGLWLFLLARVVLLAYMILVMRISSIRSPAEKT